AAVHGEELTPVAAPLQLLAGQREGDQLDERELEQPADLARDLIRERGVGPVGRPRHGSGCRPAGAGSPRRPRTSQAVAPAAPASAPCAACLIASTGACG